MWEIFKDYEKRVRDYFSYQLRSNVSLINREGIIIPVDDEFLKRIQESENKMSFPLEFARNAAYIHELTKESPDEIRKKELSDKVNPSQDL